MTATRETAPEDRPTAGSTPSRGWRTARIVALVVVVATVALAAVFGSRLGKDPTLVDTPLIGRPAPDVTLPLLEGEGSVSLRALRGQILVVNFWASWCVACRQEHPHLVAASDAYRDSGVQFIGVDFQDTTAAAVGVLNEMGRGDSYLYVSDPGSRAALEFGVYGVPETFFIDRSGTIVAKITGASTSELLDRVLDAILAGCTPDSPPEGATSTGPSADTGDGPG